MGKPLRSRRREAYAEQWRLTKLQPYKPIPVIKVLNRFTVKLRCVVNPHRLPEGSHVTRVRFVEEAKLALLRRHFGQFLKIRKMNGAWTVCRNRFKALKFRKILRFKKDTALEPFIKVSKAAVQDALEVEKLVDEVLELCRRIEVEDAPPAKSPFPDDGKTQAVGCVSDKREWSADAVKKRKSVVGAENIQKSASASGGSRVRDFPRAHSSGNSNVRSPRASATSKVRFARAAGAGNPGLERALGAGKAGQVRAAGASKRRNKKGVNRNKGGAKRAMRFLSKRLAHA